MSELETIKEHVKFYADFPKKGINFIDILPLLSDAKTFRAVIGELHKHVTSPNVAAPEARGFLFAAPLLMIDGGAQNFIAFRKNAKLPAAENDLIKVPIIKEYGDDSLYFRMSDIENAMVNEGPKPVIEITIFDDILATGGTSEGMCEKLNSLKVKRDNGEEIAVRVKEFVFLAEIGELKGKERLEKFAPVKCLITF